ncbi:MAG: hypothetical protein RIF39_11820 [Cyclobacteriaceae bacterium]
MTNNANFEGELGGVPASVWQQEIEKTTSKFHLTAAWVAVVFDPVFAITDYINIPQGWSTLFMIRICVSVITIVTILVHRKLAFSSYIVVMVPFVLISFQNAFTYQYINEEGLLGQNLNYMALLIGASMFVLWHWRFSVLIILLSAIVTFLFVANNTLLTGEAFFLKGGLLLIVSALFMIVLIQTRYRLTSNEIRARLALRASNNEIKKQAAEIKRINENLEQIVHERTLSLEKKNAALEEYAFINAHKLRSPLASILGLTNLLTKMDLGKDAAAINEHLKSSANKLDDIIGDITKAIEKGDE